MPRRSSTSLSYICTNVYAAPAATPSACRRGEAVIPDEVRRFILTSIPSVPYLEAALLFFRVPSTERTCAEVARALYLPEPRTQELIDGLCSAGVLEVLDQSPPSYRYAPRDTALADAIARLAQVYGRDMIGVTHLIHDAVAKNAYRFADAFKLRKDR